MEKKNIKSQAIAVMVLTVAQKALAFVRSAVCAAIFGATAQTDAFYMSSGIMALLANIPNTLSTAVIPMRTKESAEGGEESADAYINTILNLAMIMSIIVAGFAFVFSPFLIDIFAPGFDLEQRGVSINMLRVITPIFIMCTVISVLTAVLNYHKRFLSTGFGGIALNLMWLFLPLALWRSMGIYAMLVGYMAGVAAQALMLCFLLKGRFRYQLRLDYKNPAIRQTFAMCIPVFVSANATVICQSVEKGLASGLSSGSISALGYAQQLNHLLSTLLIEPVTVVMFTTLAQLAQKNDIHGIKALIRRSLSTLVLALLPATIYCIIFGEAIIRIVLGRGEFGSEAVHLTGMALAYYSYGFLSMGVLGVITKVFHAFMDTRTPAFGFSIFITSNVALNFILVDFIGIGGLALSSAISHTLYALILVFLLRRKLGSLGFSGLLLPLGKTILAAGALIAVSWAFKEYAQLPMAAKAAAALVASGTAYFSVLLLTRHEDVIGIVRWIWEIINKNRRV